MACDTARRDIEEKSPEIMREYSEAAKEVLAGFGFDEFMQNQIVLGLERRGLLVGTPSPSIVITVKDRNEKPIGKMSLDAHGNFYGRIEDIELVTNVLALAPEGYISGVTWTWAVVPAKKEKT